MRGTFANIRIKTKSHRVQKADTQHIYRESDIYL